ncbi:VPS9 domain-containing protein 1-like [Lineus longissimus]|uniref:VPS9 domain-containing protein 1-like n=1 Tax=Lineus longissimus TaxID=88925 RepID=UPI002B4ED56E
MEGVLERNISTALKAIAEAIKLDSGNKHVEAYWQYLQSVTFIIKCLAQDFSNKGGQQFQITNMTKKFVKLGQQSMERLGAVVENIPVSMVPNLQSEQPSYDRIPTPTDPTRKLSPYQPELPKSSLGSPRMDLSPIEQAQLKNQYLVSSYKARLAKFASPSDKRATELSLTLQRKLIENATIARTRQQAVEKKLLARRTAMEQEAAKRLSSKEDQEFFATIIKYEETAKWPLAWRERIAQNPKGERLITLLVDQILRTSDHPITKALLKYQLDIYNKIKPFVDEHVNKVNSITVPYQYEAPTEESATVNNDKDNRENAQSLAVDNISNSNSSDNIQDLETCLENDPADFSKVTEEIQEELEESKAKGDKVIAKLTADKNQNDTNSPNLAGSMTSLTVSEDFDDLFEDSFDNTEAKSDEANSAAENVCTEDVSCDASGATAEKNRTEDTGTKRLPLVTILSDEDLTSLQQSLTKDVHSCLNKLLWLFIIAYEELDTPIGRDHLYVSLEDPFFKQIWSHLLVFFRVMNREKEVELAKVMTKMMDASPEDLGINEKFCLLGGAQAYFPAVEELVKIRHFYSPLKKLQCLVNMSRSICQCVEDFYASEEAGKSQGSSLGADDLLPIMSFVVIHSRMPQLLSECAALEEFIHHGYLYGEEGYCLTSVQTALMYIGSLSKKKSSAENA